MRLIVVDKSSTDKSREKPRNWSGIFDSIDNKIIINESDLQTAAYRIKKDIDEHPFEKGYLIICHYHNFEEYEILDNDWSGFVRHRNVYFIYVADGPGRQASRRERHYRRGTPVSYSDSDTIARFVAEFIAVYDETSEPKFFLLEARQHSDRANAYSAPERFWSLWEKPEAPLPQVVTADRFPALRIGPLAANGHMSPLDWLVFHVCLRQTWPRPQYVLKITLGEAIPVEQQRLLPLFRTAFAGRVQFVESDGSTAAEQGAPAGPDLDPEGKGWLERTRQLFKPLWQQRFLASNQSSTRHTLANLVTPILFGGSPSEGAKEQPEQEDLVPLAEILRRFLQALELCPAGDTKDAARPVTWEKDRFDKVYLIDDLAHMGWESVLSELLGRRLDATIRRVDKDQIKLEGAKDTQAPNPTLLQCMERIAKESRCSYKPSVLLGKQPLVFLDFYLFAQDERSQEKFFRELLVVVDKISSHPDYSRAFTEDATFQEVKDSACRYFPRVPEAKPQISNKPDDDVISLCLLAITLAKMDPTLPIVLFTTSGRRSILQRLRPYPNIITDFEKPRLTAGIDAEAARENARAQLENALQKAAAIATGRCVLLEVHSQEKLPVDNTSSVIDPSGGDIEIYVDESGGTGNENGISIVSALIIQFRHSCTASQLNAKLRRDFPVYDDRDGGGRRVDETLPRNYLRKSDRIKLYARDQISAYAHQLQGGQYCKSFSLATVAIARHQIRATPNWPDMFYRHLLGVLLSSVLAEWIPVEWAANPTAKLRVYVGSRVLMTDDLSSMSNAVQNFGIGSRRSGQEMIFYLMDSDAVFPMLDGILRNHNMHHLYNKVDTAMCVWLNGKDDGRTHLFPWQQHYFVDAALSHLKSHIHTQSGQLNTIGLIQQRLANPAAHPKLTELAEMQERGFWFLLDGIDSPLREQAMAASRAASLGDAITALFSFWTAYRSVETVASNARSAPQQDVLKPHAASWWRYLRRRLTAMTAQLTPKTFAELCHRIALYESDPRTNP